MASTGSLLSIQMLAHAASRGEAFLEHATSQESSWEPRCAPNGNLRLPPRPQVPVGTMSAVKGAVGMAAGCARPWGCATPLAPRTLCPVGQGALGRAGGSITPHHGVGLSTGSPGCRMSPTASMRPHLPPLLAAPRWPNSPGTHGRNGTSSTKHPKLREGTPSGLCKEPNRPQILGLTFWEALAGRAEPSRGRWLDPCLCLAPEESSGAKPPRGDGHPRVYQRGSELPLPPTESSAN